MKNTVWLLLAPLLLAASPVFAQVQVENAWSRATPPGTTIAVGYLTLRNTSSKPDRLVGASSPAAAKVEPHITVKDGDISRMRAVKGYDIPANGVYRLEPGGAHLMLVGVKAPLKEGDTVPLTLEFARSGEVKTELHVQAMGATGGMGDMHGMGKMGR